MPGAIDLIATIKPMAFVTRRSILFAPAAASLASRTLFAAEETHPIPELHAALERMYNFDFVGAHKRLDAYISVHPAQPLGYSFRAAAYLFTELDRLKILE